MQFAVVAKLILFTHASNILKEGVHLFLEYAIDTDIPTGADMQHGFVRLRICAMAHFCCTVYLRQWRSGCIYFRSKLLPLLAQICSLALCACVSVLVEEECVHLFQE